jgi:phosphohistidine phosphatase
MHVWVVRHAVAAEREEFQGPDAERPLTAKGSKQFRSFARWLETKVPPPALIITSPLVRAAQTAELLRKSLGLKKKSVQQSESVSPGADPRNLLELAAKAAVESVALVGHEPDCSRALAEFIGGGEFAFGKGFIAAVEFGEHVNLGAGHLRWFVGPKIG